ncbi:hypothetical protein JTB14_037619 [Gonioctena quinquepunctata]|nr:hypothetical protein JTB14_037619 [Gonioctena quinquepunctata]
MDGSQSGWVLSLKEAGSPTILGNHFTEEDFITKPGGKRYLKFGALPIIHRKPPVRTPPKITFDLPQFGAILPEESVEPARKSKLYYLLHTEF